MLFPQRPFRWARHFVIAAVIITVNNILVILVPTIKYIFGFIGELQSSPRSSAGGWGQLVPTPSQVTHSLQPTSFPEDRGQVVYTGVGPPTSPATVSG